jgi:hypothetical protein
VLFGRFFASRENVIERVTPEVLELREEPPALGGAEFFDRGESGASDG